jgi:hypothetical protein
MYTYSIAQSINSKALGLGIFYPYALSVLNFWGIAIFCEKLPLS